MKEYSSIKEAIKIIESLSGGQQSVVAFDQENKWWVFTLTSGLRCVELKSGEAISGGVKIKILAL